MLSLLYNTRATLFRNTYKSAARVQSDAHRDQVMTYLALSLSSRPWGHTDILHRIINLEPRYTYTRAARKKGPNAQRAILYIYIRRADRASACARFYES